MTDQWQSVQLGRSVVEPSILASLIVLHGRKESRKLPQMIANAKKTMNPYLPFMDNIYIIFIVVTTKAGKHRFTTTRKAKPKQPRLASKWISLRLAAVLLVWHLRAGAPARRFWPIGIGAMVVNHGKPNENLITTILTYIHIYMHIHIYIY